MAEGQDIVGAYIDSPVDALDKDKSLAIVTMLQKMIYLIREDHLELKDKEKDKVIEKINLITSDRMQRLADERRKIKEDIGEIKKRRGVNKAAQMIDEYSYKLGHLNQRIERISGELEKIKKLNRQDELDEAIESVRKRAEDLFGIDLKIIKGVEDGKKDA